MSKFGDHKYYKLLGNASRLKILKLLARKGSQNVTQISKSTHLEQSSASHHLFAMRRLNLVKATRKGKNRIYELNRKGIGVLMDLIELFSPALA